MSLEVIGAGLGRTGTLSLKLALEHLGFGPCYHMAEMLSEIRHYFPLWLDVANGRPDWEAIYSGYHSAVDHPTCTFWRELADAYPQAKVILTRRDPDKWFDSVQATILSPGMVAAQSQSPAGEFFTRIVFEPFGDQIHDRAFMTDYFRRWNQSVIEGLPPERLLVFEAKEGWAPLCDFLGVPVPSVPYPRVNAKDEMLKSDDFEVESAGPEAIEAVGRDLIANARRQAFGES